VRDWLWNTGAIRISCSNGVEPIRLGQYEPPTLLPVEVVREERTVENLAASPAPSQSKA